MCFFIIPKLKKNKCKTLIAIDWLLDIKEKGAGICFPPLFVLVQLSKPTQIPT